VILKWILRGMKWMNVAVGRGKKHDVGDDWIQMPVRGKYFLSSWGTVRFHTGHTWEFMAFSCRLKLCPLPFLLDAPLNAMAFSKPWNEFLKT
jgi:hypothetical protein